MESSPLRSISPPVVMLKALLEVSISVLSDTVGFSARDS